MTYQLIRINSPGLREYCRSNGSIGIDGRVIGGIVDPHRWRVTPKNINSDSGRACLLWTGLVAGQHRKLKDMNLKKLREAKYKMKVQRAYAKI